MTSYGRVEHFGTDLYGDPVHLVRLRGGGTEAAVMTWGASLQDLRRDGVPHSLVLGSPDFEAYLGPMTHFGAIAGPVANRIAGGRAPLDGRVLELERNENGRTTLHGGSRGTSRSNWVLEGHDGHSCRMSIRVADGTCGFPGNLDLSVTYSLDSVGALWVEIEGHTDAPGFCSPAHHAYWTLDGREDISEHLLTVAADSYLPVDADKIPLDPAPVAGTRFDFRTPRAITAPGEEGLDHNFCLRETEGLHPVCTLTAGGLQLDVTSTEPGLQVYDAGAMSTAPRTGHGGLPYGPLAGVALEPQRWPDAPNRSGFPPVVLRPGETYFQRSRFYIHEY
ncbi:aldose epimerase family protein [Salipiger mucosus]|uniref:Aldose 1-epimerase n=1 Tax=Salipiger mucosus DSM 16094 TaxID=1123237 RepID=S9SBT1_9RHOB|nr:aldose epimerase family protein [Salipiger mucosus]EPX83679.1 Aldose 1-epimerase [Salipiger mucosus DSM 16094]